MVRSILVALAIAVAAMLPMGSRAGGVRYAITDLGTLGGSESRAYGINDVGQVVGTSITASGWWHAFLWQDGAMRDLGTLGGLYSAAHAINDAGQVVGMAYTDDDDEFNFNIHAFLWQGGVMADIGTLADGWGDSAAFAINNAGQVVGGASCGSGAVYHAFLWQGGVMRDLGTLGGWDSEAYGINDAGQVVGWSHIASGHERAFLWQGGTMRNLGTLGGPGSLISEANGINDAGQVVGWSYTASGYMRAFLWQGGAMRDLGTLSGPYSYAYDINDAGQVVGESGPHAFLWQGGAMRDLGTLGGSYSGASGINDAGQVVGEAQTASGETHACLWSPVKPVVVLVRGLHVWWEKDPPNYWRDAKEFLQQKGFEVWVCDTVLGRHNVETEAGRLQTFIRNKVQTLRDSGLPVPTSISIVAHSYGGLITRAYLRMRQPDEPVVEKVVMLSTPNCGSHIADDPLAVLGNAQAAGAMLCLRTHYVQDVFNSTYNDSTPVVPFYLIGATGGATSSDWTLRLGHSTLYWWPDGTENPNDGAVTKYSALGKRWMCDIGDGYCEDVINRELINWTLQRQVGSAWTYVTGDDHTNVTRNVTTLQLVWRALLGERLPASTQAMMAAAESTSNPSAPVAAAGGTVLQGETKQVVSPVDDCAQVRFSLQLPSGKGNFTLTTPSGGVIDPTTTDPEVRYSESVDECGTRAEYRIDTPAIGNWIARVSVTEAPQEGTTWSIAIDEDSTPLRLLEATSYFQPAGNALVRTTLLNGSQGMAGAAVEADVTRPDSTVDHIILYDDGAHSDGAASDGLYGAYYTASAAPGIYNVSYTATGTNTSAHAFQRIDWNTMQMAPATATLSGVYSDQGVDLGPPAGFEQIAVNVGVNVAAEGKYAVSAALADSEGNKLAAASTSAGTLPPGSATVTLSFDGDTLRQSGVDGPYRLIDVALWDESGEMTLRADYQAQPYTTAAYSCSQFSDSFPPQAVTDLAVSNVTETGVTLGWTAPSSEGAAAAAYDMRYSTEALDPESWSTATPVSNPPAPAAPGVAQSFAVENLAPGRFYYFGIKSRDQAGNESALSNIAEVYAGTMDVRHSGNGTYGGVFGSVTASVQGMPGSYIESRDRTWGARVDTNGLQEGSRLYVTGSLQTVDGERVLMWPKVLDLGAGDPVKPIGVGCGALQASGGLAPDCLLVRAWGAFTKVDDSTFTLDDGGGAVKCVVPSGVTLESGWTYAAATGIASHEKVGQEVRRVLRVRRQSDIVPL